MNLETKVILTDLLLMLLPSLSVYFHIKRLIDTTKKQDDCIGKQRVRIDELEYKVNHPLNFKTKDIVLLGNIKAIVDKIRLNKNEYYNSFNWIIDVISISDTPILYSIDDYTEIKPYKKETLITPQTPNLTPAIHQTSYGTVGWEVKPTKNKRSKSRLTKQSKK